MKTSRCDRPSVYTIGFTLKPGRCGARPCTRLATKPACRRRFSTLHNAHSPVCAQPGFVEFAVVAPLVDVAVPIAAGAVAGAAFGSELDDCSHPTTKMPMHSVRQCEAIDMGIKHASPCLPKTDSFAGFSSSMARR